MNKRFLTTISIAATVGMLLTGCSQGGTSNVAKGNAATGNTAVGRTTGNTATSSGAPNNMAANNAAASTGSPSNASQDAGSSQGAGTTGTGTTGSGTTDTPITISSDGTSVINGIQSAPAQMGESVQASVKWNQYGIGITSVLFVSSTTGYLAGKGIILKSTDGGRIFKTAYQTKVDVAGLTHPTGDNATIVAWGGKDVLVSRDGGSGWNTYTVPVASTSGSHSADTIQEVAFATPSEGFAVVGNNWQTDVLWKTTDGGAHWTQLTTPGTPISVSFGSASVGWMATVSGDIYETKDAGATWTRVFHPSTSSTSSTSYPGRPEVHAVSARSCWAMVIGGSGMSQTSYAVFRTTNGSTWKPVLGIDTAGAGPAPDGAKGMPKGPGSSPGPMVALSANQAVVTGTCRACGMGTGQVTTTGNGGQSWNTQPTIPNSITPPSDMSFVSLSDGWMLDATPKDGSFLLHTIDGGKTWREVYPMVHPHPVEGLSFVTPSVGYGLGVPGDANVIVKSTDGGHTWAQVGALPVTYGSSEPFMQPGHSAIDFVSASHGYAIGSDGAIYETQDGGKTWAKANVPKLHDPFVSITFADNGKLGMATTYSSHAEVTADAGRTWHEVTFSNDASSDMQGALYLAGLAKLPTAGTLKTMVHTQTASWLGFHGTELGWVPAQSGQGYFMTTDGGANWHEVAFGQDYSHQPVSMDFVNVKDGWMITLSGGLLRTTDGGQTWVHAVHTGP